MFRLLQGLVVMRGTMSLSGTWEGEYTYNYGTQNDPDVVYYGIRLEIREKGRNLTGNWTDLDKELESSTINGFIEGEFISFIQNYEQLILEDESRNLPTNLLKPFTEIHYTRNFNNEDPSYMRYWEIAVAEERLDASDVVTEYRTGAWYIKRV